MIKYIILFFLIITQFSCEFHHNVSNDKELSLGLNKAWNERDTLFLRKYVDNLGHSNLDDFTFYGRIEELSSKSMFFFGNERVCADQECDRWHKLSRKQKDILRYNVFRVYQLYVNSSIVFNDRITWDETLKKIHQKYYTDKHKFEEEEIRKIENVISTLSSK